MQGSAEYQLTAKLVRSWHLDAQEREALPEGEAKGSLVIAALVDAAERDGWYPASWRPNDAFDGGLIEVVPDGTYQVHWKVESGVGRFELLQTQAYATLREACEAYASRFFGPSIDGIPVNWHR